MSLLLEALKKAEKAKEEAQRRSREGDASPAHDPDATVLDPGKPVTTRDQLPDISSPLEILSDDLHPASPPKPAGIELRLAEEAPPPREPKAAPRAAEPPPPAAGRAAAQRVFEAKFKEPNPRLPFFIVMGVLGAFAIGTVIYFWIQLRPAPPLVNANPPRSSDEKPVDAGAVPPSPAGAAAAGAPPATAAAPVPAASATAASPAGSPSPAATTSASPIPAQANPAAPARDSKPPAARPAAARAPAKPSEDDTVNVNRGAPQIHPQVASGYAAYEAGDLAKARNDYQQVLREEPSNRDALLGLAAVEMRSQRFDLADGYYQRVLRIDPRDPHAQAGVVALRAQQLDPVQVESRVKTLIAADREANVLYFTLGNQYAQQGRWAEAQQAYFKAFAADPDNPDFAFNLAVSLDQLRQPRLALEYYRRALSLAERRTAAFAPEAARTRVQQLAAGSR